MTTAEDLLREGKLRDALSELQQQVRRDPSSASLRIFLFQLLAVDGQWDRALTQLNVVGDLDDGAQLMVQSYREAIRCELLRGEVFAGRRSPLVFGEPQPWVAKLVEATRLTAQQQYPQAQALRDEAFEEAPTSSGTLRLDEAEGGGSRFEWIADADSRLGPVVEVIVNGKYYWAPVDRFREIHLEAPVDLRDLVWMPAKFIWSNGGETLGLIPTRYPNSETSDDEMIRLCRKSEWLNPAENVYLGLGQRIFATDSDDFPLMDVRQIIMDGA